MKYFSKINPRLRERERESKTPHRFVKLLFSFLLFVVFFFTLHSSVYAATYYVATTGSDSNTTTQAQSSTTPWLTLNGAESKAATGDTIHVAAGTYVETANGGQWATSKGISWIADGVVIVRGTTNPVFIYGTAVGSYSGFTFDAQNTYASSVVFASTAANKTLSNIQFIGATSSVVSFSAGANIIIQNSTFTIGSGVIGVSLSNNSGNITISGSTLNFSSCNYLFRRTTAGSPITFSNNTITGDTCSGPLFYLGYAGDISLTGNTINISGSISNLFLASAGSGSVRISNNTITLSTKTSNDIIFFSAGTWNVDIDGNTITSTATDQVFDPIDVANQYSPIVQNNTIQTSSTSQRESILISSSGTDCGTVSIKNNIIKSISSTYLIRIGADAASASSGNQKINGVTVDGNTLYGPVYYDPTKVTSITHGIFVGDNLNGIVRYNTIFGTGIGVVMKEYGGTYTSGGVYYNKIINSNADSAIRVKGVKNLPIYNNSIYSNSTITNRLIFITENNTGQYATGTVVKNNILYCGNCDAFTINAGSDTGFVSDNNIIYRDTGTEIGVISATTYSNFSSWQTAGFDTHSANSNPLYINTGTSDLRLQRTSPAINLGVDLGFIRDFVGTSVPQGSAPDIGAYEFILPSSPSVLSQYKSDGTTVIGSGGWSGTSNVLKFSMASTNASDSLTPQVEIEPIGTAFTNTVTNSGSAVVYSGSSVTGVVTVTGLTAGNYHWQARVSNSAGQSAWVSKGGSPDFVVDATAPVTTDSVDTTSNVVVTFSCTDASGSGCANTYYTTDGSTPTTSSQSGNSVVLVAHKDYTIKYFSVDNVGNIESIKSDFIAAVFSPASGSVSAPSCNDPVTSGSPDLFEIHTTKDSATLYFAPPVMPYSKFYIAFSRKADSWEYGTEYNQGHTTGVLQYTINSLQPNTKYYIRLRAGNGCATGNWSNTMTVTTSQSANKKTFYKNVFTAITQTVKSVVGKVTPTKTTTKTTTQTPSPTSNPIMTSKPVVTNQPQVATKKFCILWWCF